MDAFTKDEDELLQAKIDSSCFILDEETILNYAKYDGPINNVVTGLSKECFGMVIVKEEPTIEYGLIYITTRNGELVGDMLKLKFWEHDNNYITVAFAKMLCTENPHLFLSNTYNTLQFNVRTFAESSGYLTYDRFSDLKHVEGHISIFARKPLIEILSIDEVLIIRSIFDDIYLNPRPVNTHVVYVLYNGNDQLCKIGRSKHVTYRERTLQGQQPEIELIAFWEADSSLEKSLHYHFRTKRIRGEWFKLSYSDLLDLKKQVEKFIVNN